MFKLLFYQKVSVLTSFENANYEIAIFQILYFALSVLQHRYSMYFWYTVEKQLKWPLTLIMIRLRLCYYYGNLNFSWNSGRCTYCFDFWVSDFLVSQIMLSHILHPTKMMCFSDMFRSYTVRLFLLWHMKYILKLFIP